MSKKQETAFQPIAMKCTQDIKSVTNCPTCGCECSIVVNEETHSYKPKITLPALPYGAQLICKEMEVSDDEIKSYIFYVLFKDKFGRYHIFCDDGTVTYYKHAREIDPQRKEIEAKINELENQIAELRKELENGK